MDIFVILTGTVVGSFLNVCIYRIPGKESIVWKPSHCPHCKEKLHWTHLLPIFSFFVLGRKCAFCSQKISWQYPVVESFTGLSFYFIYLQWGFSLLFFKYTILISILIVISFIDVKYLIIPNKIIAVGLLSAIAFYLFEPRSEIIESIIGGTVGGCFLSGIALSGQLLFNKTGMGSGDIKFAAMLGLYTGWQGILYVIAIAAVSGALIGITGILLGKLERMNRIPFAPFLAFGTILYLIQFHESISIVL